MYKKYSQKMNLIFSFTKYLITFCKKFLFSICKSQQLSQISNQNNTDIRKEIIYEKLIYFPVVIRKIICEYDYNFEGELETNMNITACSQIDKLNKFSIWELEFIIKNLEIYLDVKVIKNHLIALGRKNIRVWGQDKENDIHIDLESDDNTLYILNENQIITGENSKILKHWTLFYKSSHKYLQILYEYKDNINIIKILSNNRVLSQSYDGELTIINVETKECYFKILNTEEIKYVLETSSDEIILVTLLNKWMLLKNKTYTELFPHEIKNPLKSILTPKLLSKTQIIYYTISFDDLKDGGINYGGTDIEVFNYKTGEITILNKNQSVIDFTILSETSFALITSKHYDDNFKIFQFTSDNTWVSHNINDNSPKIVGILPDSYIFSCGDNGPLNIWNSNTFKLEKSIDLNHRSVVHAKLLPNNRLIFSFKDGTVKIFK